MAYAQKAPTQMTTPCVSTLFGDHVFAMFSLNVSSHRFCFERHPATKKRMSNGSEPCKGGMPHSKNPDTRMTPWTKPTPAPHNNIHNGEGHGIVGTFPAPIRSTHPIVKIKSTSKNHGGPTSTGHPSGHSISPTKTVANHMIQPWARKKKKKSGNPIRLNRSRTNSRTPFLASDAGVK